MSNWYTCPNCNIQYHEDADCDYGHSCPSCNRDVLIAELRASMLAVITLVDDEQYYVHPQIMERANIALTVHPGYSYIKEAIKYLRKKEEVERDD